MLKHAKGNLIDMAEAGDFDIIVHGCNCQHTMGSGIAKEIRERYPKAYEADGKSMMHGIYKLGNMTSAVITNYAPDVTNLNNGTIQFEIINAYTQVNYMPRGVDHFEYSSFELILRKLAWARPTSRFGFPYIGMGLAGGDRNVIMIMLENFARTIGSEGSVTLVEFA